MLETCLEPVGERIRRFNDGRHRSDLSGKARAWNVPSTSDLDFEPQAALTAGGWFARGSVVNSEPDTPSDGVSVGHGYTPLIRTV